MRRRLAILAAVLATSALAACTQSPAPPSAEPKVVDLGHALAATDPSWEGTPVFSYTTLETFATSGYQLGKFSSDEHFGTHVDAPAHFAAGGLTVDKIPADRLVRPAVCINVATKAASDDDYRVTPSDVLAFEREHGAIAAGTVVLIATGWDTRWPDAARYMNTRAGVKHFPGLSVEAATLLAKDRHVAGIGIDTASIDYGPSEKFEAHHATQPEGVYHIENAANLTSLPATGFTVVVAPIKIAGGTGGPARVFALLR